MKTVVISGATSGIGLAVAGEFAGRNWQVIGLGRSDQRCESARQELSRRYPGAHLRFFAADLMQLSEIDRISSVLAEYLEQICGSRLDALINNAGCVRSWYSTTPDGFEQQFALNHLAGFMLTRKLMPNLLKAGGRILFTGSQSHKVVTVQ